MGQRPQVTKTTHPLPFNRLSPVDFERMCLWLVDREGYEGGEALGEAGNEQGRDIVAWKENRRVAFQCKRVQQFGPKSARVEIEKVRSLREDEQPDEMIFLVTCRVSARTRKTARSAWGDEGTCSFWSGAELDEKVKRHAEILKEFFDLSQRQVAPTWPSLRHTPFGHRQLLMALLAVSVIQFLLYDQLVSATDRLIESGLTPLLAFGYVMIAVSVGSPMILLTVLRGGVNASELPILVTAIVNSLLLGFLLYRLVFALARQLSKKRRSRE